MLFRPPGAGRRPRGAPCCLCADESFVSLASLIPSSAREWMPSLRYTRDRFASTVFWLTNAAAAISRLLRPEAAVRRRTGRDGKARGDPARCVRSRGRRLDCVAGVLPQRGDALALIVLPPAAVSGERGAFELVPGRGRVRPGLRSSLGSCTDALCLAEREPTGGARRGRRRRSGGVPRDYAQHLCAVESVTEPVGVPTGRASAASSAGRAVPWRAPGPGFVPPSLGVPEADPRRRPSRRPSSGAAGAQDRRATRRA
jgi:hypothetical protein